MSIVEIHGKLSAEAHEGLEDLLTSDVFGTMLYAGWQPAFHAWMSEAQGAPSLTPGSSFAQFPAAPCGDAQGRLFVLAEAAE